MNRRNFIQQCAGLSAALTVAQQLGARAADATPDGDTIVIEPQPRHELSPWLYMQFMEPLGTTDGSVEASWDHLHARWRPDLIAATKELAPPMMRWGGLFSSYYRWREGVGPRAQRRPMHNLHWGGMESNQVGTAEFLDFCRQVQAEPLMCVNFEAEGDPAWAVNALGESRAGNAQEAAEWVDYCNNPGNKLRRAHGHAEPFPIRVWQLGNETSFSATRFGRDAAIRKTVEFAQAMRKADAKIQLIGWGDSGWAPDMIEKAGEHLDYVAFHNLFDPGAPLSDAAYQRDPAATWDALIGAVKKQERKILAVRAQVERPKFKLAMTESHFTMQGRNRCDLNSAWATGVAYARFLNLHQRHGDLLKIANLGDFCGTRWQSNVIMIPTPGGQSYLMPLGRVTALYRQHTGAQFVRVGGGPSDLDITASRTGEDFFLHVVNTSRTRAHACRLAVPGFVVESGTAFGIAVDPMAEITSAKDDPMKLLQQTVAPATPHIFPAASVTAVVLKARVV